MRKAFQFLARHSQGGNKDATHRGDCNRSRCKEESYKSISLTRDVEAQFPCPIVGLVLTIPYFTWFFRWLNYSRSISGFSCKSAFNSEL